VPGRRQQLAVALLLAVAAGAAGAPVAGALSADAGGSYRGRTSSGGTVTARVAPRGAFVALIRFQWRARCANGATLIGATDQMQIAIGQEGGFPLRGAYELRLPAERRAWVIANQRGRLLAGALRGRFRAAATVRDRSRAIIDRCDTGPQSWSARRIGR
jgi:hypothetical protein